MKKILFVLLFFAIPSVGWAAGAGSGPGCGLGAVVFKSKSGFFPHTSAATTNQSSFSQLGGISSGTSGCGGYETIRISAAFIKANQEQFATDMSRGEGEVLDNYIALIGVRSEDYTVIRQFFKTNFSAVYQKQEMESLEIANRLNNLLKKHEYLSRYAI
jgi:hypothetical protein